MKRKFSYLSSIAGCFLLILPNGLSWFWGNLSVYTLSYIYSQDSSLTTVQSPWTLFIFFITWPFGILISEPIAKVMGVRMTMAVGTLIFCIGDFSTFWTIERSFLLMNMVFGGLLGFGSGILRGMILNVIVEWGDHNVGFLMSLVQSSSTVGGIIVNDFLTFYVNPDDKPPDRQIGPSFFFTYKDVVDKVPLVYIFLGIYDAAIHFLGLSLIRHKNASNEETKSILLSDGETKATTRADITHKFQAKGALEDHLALNGEAKAAAGIGNTPKSQSNVLEEHQASKKENENIDARNYKPKELLTSAKFYVLWYGIGMCFMSIGCFSTYYKAFGQVWIKDDHFFSTLATVFSIMICPLRICWGLLCDRLRVKDFLIVYITSMTLVSTFYYFTAMTDKWLYFAWTICFTGIISGLFPVFTAAVLRTFGSTHNTTNYGMVSTSLIAFSALTPTLVKYVLMEYGWFYLFGGIGLLNCVGLILVVVVL